MNLLARILSHGFALALVALIAIALMYRGELFPEWELPDFLVVDDSPDSGQAETSSEEIHPQTGAAVTSPESAADETTDAVVVPPAAFQDGTIATEPVTDSLAAPTADQAIDDSVQQAPVDSDGGTDEPVDTDPVGLIDSEPDSGDQSALDNDAVDSKALDPSASEPVADAVTPVVVAKEATQQAETVAPAVVAEEATQQAETVAPAVVAKEATQQAETVAPAVVAEEATPQADTVTSAVVSEEVTQQAATDTPATEAAVSTDMAPVEEKAQQPASAAEAITSPDIPEAPEPVATEASDAMATMPGSVAVTPEHVTPKEQPVAQTASSQLSDSSAAAEDDREKTAHELLAAAREAYWLRDYDGAEKYYNQLIELEPDNPDGYGELGNMYFAQGQWDEAAAAYYEAGVRLVNEGVTVQARQLVDVIRGLNGKQADELEKQVDAASRITP